MGYNKVYFLDDRQLYGKGVVDAFIQQAEKVGIEVVGRDGVESTDIDFRALLTKVKAANPDMVYGSFVIDSGGPESFSRWPPWVSSSRASSSWGLTAWSTRPWWSRWAARMWPTVISS